MAMLNNQRVYVQVTIQCTRIDGLSTSPDGGTCICTFRMAKWSTWQYQVTVSYLKKMDSELLKYSNMRYIIDKKNCLWKPVDTCKLHNSLESSTASVDFPWPCSPRRAQPPGPKVKSTGFGVKAPGKSWESGSLREPWGEKTYLEAWGFSKPM